MRVTVDDRGMTLRERLAERLRLAGELRCVEHGGAVDAVRIMGRENGWFDALWTTCCERLTNAAHAIVRDRC
ncbi:MAG TPA: hypothetical protein VGR02_09465 [Thermoanaerobaculia bacterium]|nr:hypothetical protein [Thermoanaerobaculia bacterium]